MYRRGQGVPQDDKEAVKWYRLAADQGDAQAQYNLGLMYSEGQGVQQDYPLAYMWWNLCDSNVHKDAIHNRNILEENMTPQQIEKAQGMLRNWKPKTK